jgi:hypothetical protein
VATISATFKLVGRKAAAGPPREGVAIPWLHTNAEASHAINVAHGEASRPWSTIGLGSAQTRVASFPFLYNPRPDWDRRVTADRPHAASGFTAVLGPLAPATGLLAASTEKRVGMARHPRGRSGLTVIVADPKYAPHVRHPRPAGARPDRATPRTTRRGRAGVGALPPGAPALRTPAGDVRAERASATRGSAPGPLLPSRIVEVVRPSATGCGVAGSEERARGPSGNRRALSCRGRWRVKLAAAVSPSSHRLNAEIVGGGGPRIGGSAQLDRGGPRFVRAAHDRAGESGPRIRRARWSPTIDDITRFPLVRARVRADSRRRAPGERRSSGREAAEWGGITKGGERARALLLVWRAVFEGVIVRSAEMRETAALAGVGGPASRRGAASGSPLVALRGAAGGDPVRDFCGRDGAAYDGRKVLRAPTCRRRRQPNVEDRVGRVDD